MWWWIKIHITKGETDMFRWFKTRKKLLEEIKLQEKYIKALEDELKRHLEGRVERITDYEKIKIDQEELI